MDQRFAIKRFCMKVNLMNNLSGWKLKEPKKIQTWPGVNPDLLPDDQMQHSVLLANQANWRAGHCVLCIFPEYDQLNAR